MSNTKIAMSSGRKGKNNVQTNICVICLCRICDAQFGVNVYANHCILHPFNKQQLKHYKEQNKIQKIKDVNLDYLQRVKNLHNYSSIPFMRNSIHVKQRYLADIVC